MSQIKTFQKTNINHFFFFFTIIFIFSIIIQKKNLSIFDQSRTESKPPLQVFSTFQNFFTFSIIEKIE